MTDEQKAVFLLLDRIKNEGLQWYRHAALEDVAVFERRISGKFSIFDGGELHEIGLKPSDIISILQAIKTAGSLQAELVIQ